MGLAGKIKNSGSDAGAAHGSAGAAAQQQLYGNSTHAAYPSNYNAQQPYLIAAPDHQSHLSFNNPIPQPHLQYYNSQYAAQQYSQPYAAAASSHHSPSYIASSAHHSQQYALTQHSHSIFAGGAPLATTVNNNYPPQSLPYSQPPPPASAPPHQQYHFQISSTPASHTMNLLTQKLQSIVQRNGLQHFYNPSRLQSVLHKVASINFADIAAQWSIGRELAYDLAPLALYDIVFYCDDSSSMSHDEDGERINDLKFILSKVSNIATLFDDDGIIVRFINSDVNGDGIRNAADVTKLISQVDFDGYTPLGTNFDSKVIQPFVIGQATGYNNAAPAYMAKPVLAIIITDGEPNGEAEDKIIQVIRHAKEALSRSPYGSGALAVEIAQVGKDADTQKFLESLDKDPIVGRMIDCTSYYEMEEQEFARKGVTLTPDLWLLKMCVGAIDPEYDSKDD